MRPIWHAPAAVGPRCRLKGYSLSTEGQAAGQQGRLKAGYAAC